MVHSEFFHDVLGTVAGHFVKHIVSPSNHGVFPWLSGMANLYESYRFNSLRFRYENRVGTTHDGSFAMAPDYDNNDDFPLSKGDLLSYDDRATSATYKPCSFACSRENLNKRSTFFTGPVPVGKDPNLYNVANLFFFTGGCPNANQIGELYVDYDITFMTPQAIPVIPNPYPDGIGGGWFGTSNAAPFGTSYESNSLLLSDTCTVICTGTTTSVTTISFAKEWRGFVTANYVGTSLTAITESGTASRFQIFTEIGFATQVANCFQIHAQVGETYILTMGNASITRADIVFGQAPNVLA